jgi:biopolymer transport protein ExbD
MADIQITPKKGRHKIHAMRVDLTPMVDLGFLLISFFMYTTTMARPKTMEINKPVPGGVSVAYPGEGTITVIPTKDHKVVYYKGALDAHKTGISNFSDDGIRVVLQQTQQEAKALPASFSAEAHKLHVLIKPADNCTYQDIVSIMDEMEILDVPYYVMSDLNDAEKAFLTEKLQ